MSFLDEVRAKRQKLADVLSDEEYSGIREIVEELYPDRAHFIYELLQNAEDRGATKASFVLHKESITFEHDGQPFSEEDVWRITNIGKRKEQKDQIGRFGVGFKAVFGYTETPYIWSPTFSFKLSELVLPTEIAPNPTLGDVTRFEFPFNNPKKAAQDAFEEAKAGLEELAETTLLFLSSLESIRWRIDEDTTGEVLRINHPANHIEVLKKTGVRTTVSSNFLVFSDSVKGLERQRVALAFGLDYLPNVTAFDPRAPLANQLKIVPATPGRVAVFFPAEKESSGLRFHLHAPFVPELSRASIKETPVNHPLFEQLAKLAAASLHSIRDLHLLTAGFLGVLPNLQDDMLKRYEPIRAAIIEEMNKEPLTPTYAKSYAPARHLLQAKASLKDLLTAEDLDFLVASKEEGFQWAVSASQKNSNADRFLSGLAITEWDTDKFIDVLDLKLSERQRYLQTAPWSTHGPDQQFISWLAAKPIEWHQRFYALLHGDLLSNPEYDRRRAIDRLKRLHVVRLSNGTYNIGSRCYFPSDVVEHDDILPRVARAVYSSGKSKIQQEEARRLLEKLDVREVGEVEEVQAILKQRYTLEAEAPDEKTYRKDLKRFIALVEKEPKCATLFSGFYIFERACDDWGTSTQVFLDSPYLETGLNAYYQALGDDAPKAPLAPEYSQYGISVQRLRKFAEALGVQKYLQVVEGRCYENPQWSYLSSVPGERYTSPINQDFAIPAFQEVMSSPTLELSKLVWRTMCSLPRYPDYLQARYRKNESNGSRYAASQLVHQLRTCAWVPQANGDFVHPSQASRELLPNGFPFDEGYEWLKAIGFGERSRQLVEANRKRESVARELGFPDAQSLERAKQFATLPQAEQERLLAEFQRRQKPELPEHEPRNPERRAERVAREAANAPERITEERTRSVSVGREDVKDEAEEYLRELYTNPDGEMICQICKAELPFKLDDGSFYFEKVEFLEELTKRHRQNYLALCPNHRAMFKHVNGSRDVMKAMVCELVGNELQVALAQTDASIYFTKTHLADLRTVIEVDGADDTPISVGQ